MKEKQFVLIQLGEVFARTDNKQRAIRLAKLEAVKNGLDVWIEERRPTIRVRRDGYVYDVA
jgi:hypothetical protein